MAGIEKRMRVTAQCRAIAHLATKIALIHSDKAEMFAAGCQDSLIGGGGDDAADIMETLADILYCMGALADDDIQRTCDIPQPD